MTPDEIEDLALDGGELPKNLGYADTLLFLMFRSLYDFAARTQMDRVQGKREKERILQVFHQYKFDEYCARERGNWYRDTEQARTRYLKNPTLENADKLLEVIDGIPMHRTNVECP